MLRNLVGIAWLIAGPLAATPIQVDGTGFSGNSGWGHVDLVGDGVHLGLALGGGVQLAAVFCLAGAPCGLPLDGGGQALDPSDDTEIGGTYLGHTIAPDTPAMASVSFHGFAKFNEQNPDVLSHIDWSGWVRFSGIQLNFTGVGEDRPGFEIHSANDPACPDRPCPGRFFIFTSVQGPFTAQLEEVPEPSTWALAGSGLIAAMAVTVRRRRRCG